jgi:hypothetical protein
MWIIINGACKPLTSITASKWIWDMIMNPKIISGFQQWVMEEI